jgi:hypothetical protein
MLERLHMNDTNARLRLAPQPGDSAARGSATPVEDLRNNPDPDRLIRQAELFVERMAVSAATGHRLRAAGKIGPRPVKVSGQVIRYYLPEVLAWLRHRRPDGSLHDAKTWPAVWAQLQRE